VSWQLAGGMTWDLRTGSETNHGIIHLLIDDEITVAFTPGKKTGYFQSSFPGVEGAGIAAGCL